MAHFIPSTQNAKPTYILGYGISEASYTELTRKLARNIIMKRGGKIDDLIQAKDLTACIIVPSIAETQTSPHCLKNLRKKDFDHLIQAFFLKEGGLTGTDFEPGISYVCNRARSNQVPSAPTEEDDNLADKVLSGEVKKKDFEQIISDLCWDRDIKNLRYYSWEFPISVLGKLIKKIGDIANQILKIGYSTIVFVGWLTIFGVGIAVLFRPKKGPEVVEVMSKYIAPAFKASISTIHISKA